MKMHCIRGNCFAKMSIPSKNIHIKLGILGKVSTKMLVNFQEGHFLKKS